MLLLTNAVLATMAGDTPYGLIARGAVAVEGERIAWAGPQAELPQRFSRMETLDAGGRLVTPGLVDCHTHVVHGGNRAREFELRLQGASYEEIARAGGGILSTVEATRAASEEQLLASALPRIDAMIACGVTTVEIKSGYGLDIETELRMLRVARRIALERPVEVRTSLLAAHAVPPQYRSSANGADAYVEEVCLPALEAAHAQGLADAVDGFCEAIAFDARQIARIFERARALGLPVKLHAEQLSQGGGTQLAARFGALSADHLEHADEADARALAKAGSVAVLLPGAYYTLRETKLPPVEALRASNVPIAVATDCNPGSSPMVSLPLAMNMACTLFRLTPEEALAGATRNAASALGLADRGAIAAGLRADLAIWDAEHPAELSYRTGVAPLHRRIFAGTIGAGVVGAGKSGEAA
jgi:imidazolonepropionase